MKMIFELVIVALLAHVSEATIAVAKTPIMGFSTWNTFRQDINDTLIREIGDTLISSGLAEAGYVYVNIDDGYTSRALGWAAYDRDSNGKMVGHPTKFPKGMRDLSDYLHSKGLKFGLYTARNNRTCGSQMPGSLGHEDVDAQTFADMGADWVKNDDCRVVYEDATKDYGAFQRAIAKTDRPMLHNVKAPDLNPSNALEVSQFRRVGKDLHNSWHNLIRVLDTGLDPSFAAIVGHNFFNDFDMLEIAASTRAREPGMTVPEWQAHMSLWSALKSPLQIGCDIRGLAKAPLDIMLNKNVIAVNQDPLAVPVSLIKSIPPSTYSNDTKATLRVCTEAANQQWTVGNDHIKSSDGRCLGLLEGESRWPFGTSLTSCGNSNQHQKWTLNGSQIVSDGKGCWPGEGSCCLSVEGSNPEIDQCNWTPNKARQDWFINGTSIVSALNGLCLTMGDQLEIYAGPLVGGVQTVVFFNRGPLTASGTISFTNLGWATETKATAFDLWKNTTVGTVTGEFRASVEPHSVVHVNLTPSS